MSVDVFQAPLRPGDTDKQTIGCRHNKPMFCAKNRLPKICAFVRTDGVCLNPPRGWRGQYRKLGGQPT